MVAQILHSHREPDVDDEYVRSNEPARHAEPNNLREVPRPKLTCVCVSAAEREEKYKVLYLACEAFSVNTENTACFI